MSHLRRLHHSLRILPRNHTLLWVMVAQYALLSLVALLGYLLGRIILYQINPTGITMLENALEIAGQQVTQKTAADALTLAIHALWNFPTVATILILALIQTVLLTLLGSWFSAGAYGMIKNLLQDGSTTIREFKPGTRRYLWPLFRFSMLRTALFAVPLIPLTLAGVSLMGTTRELVTPQQTMVFLLTFLFFVLVTVIVSLLFLYGDAVVVFEDVGAFEAARRTIKLVRKHLFTSITAGLLMLGVFGLVGVLSSLLLAPFQMFAQRSQQWAQALFVGNMLVNFLFIAVSVVLVIFIFHTYHELSGGVVREAPKKRAKKSA